MLTEDERIDLIDNLGLSGEDVMVLDFDELGDGLFNVLVVEGQRIMLLTVTARGDGIVTTIRALVDTDDPRGCDLDVRSGVRITTVLNQVDTSPD